MPFKHKIQILDLQYALKASAGNKQLAYNLLAIFISQLEAYHQNIKKDLHTNNAEGLQNSIHKLNGALQYIGAPSLLQKVSELDGQINSFSYDILTIKINHILDLLNKINREEKYQ